ncbi:alpha/beta fold hydrolase [Aquabacterium sp. OR-4]|uniref:alpha/beta fold hydrolase n=1 Tax=Aquabacterium sp. OR-4 TaxID=2978127 RepID=UPI0028CACEF3|nr:alpha/beta fold hydrolase [Aquabacterium sp. OR-4]MDT7838444.1 alpha/beta fold hydrolase [Aquabacterium sp. OR-4]
MSTASPATWVLLRGLTREAGHWGGFGAQLAQALARVPAGPGPGAGGRAVGVAPRIVMLDLPGAGALHQARCPLQVQAMLPACQAQLQALGVAGPVHLLGLSLGGMVATAWAATQPRQVAALVVVNTSLRPHSPVQQRLQLRHLPHLLRLLAPADALAAERAILALTSAWPERHAAVLADWVAIRQARPVRAANALRQLWAAARFSHPGAPPPVPTLVLGSAGDGLVSPRCSQALAQAWGCAFVQHPAAGHDLPLDDGAWVAAQVAAQMAAWVAAGAPGP